MQTINVSHNFALVHYGWKDFFPISNEMKPRKVINKGITYLSYARSKKLGNSLNITYMGYMPDLYIGDWLVLVTSNKGSLDTYEEQENSQNFYLNKGIVKFIGQVQSITSQYNADADGILKKSYNIQVREWSHCLNIPLRYSDEMAVLSTKELGQTTKLFNQLKETGAAGESGFVGSNAKEDNWRTFTSNRLPAFQIIKNVTTMMGLRSALSNKKDKNLKISLTTSDLPSIPKSIYEDHILKYEDEKYEQKFPFNTGFLFELIGIQTWENMKLENNLFNPEYIEYIVNEEAVRPPAFVTPAMYAQGLLFSAVVEKVLESGGEYETFSDLLYFKNEDNLVLCKPILVVRDKPISFRSIANSKDNKIYKNSELNFGFTYKDDIPRITVPLTNVLSFSVSYSIQNTRNYIQFSPVAKYIKEAYLVTAALNYGRYKDSFSQDRFGGQEYVASTAEFVGIIPTVPAAPPPAPVKKTAAKQKNQKSKNTKNKTNPAANTAAQNAQSQSEARLASQVNKVFGEWLAALAEKYKYYLPAKFAMPNCTVQIIDNDFPLTVGLMVRIPLGEGRPTICGEIEEISSTYTISGDGRISNQTYVKLADLLMENPQDPKILNIIPKEFSRTLFVDINQQNVDQENFVKIRN